MHMAGQPRPAFYVAVGVVTVALVGFAVYQSDKLFPKAPPKTTVATAPISPREIEPPAEAKDSAAVTTTKEYTFKPAERLPEVKGISAYKPPQGDTIRFAINVW